jgi:hypothetical protein
VTQAWAGGRSARGCSASSTRSRSYQPCTNSRPSARPEPKPDEDAQQEIAECDAELRQHRAALEAGADPVLVTNWVKETQARRALAEARLKKPMARRRKTHEEITSLVTEMGRIMRALKEADPADKAEVNSRLGLTLTHHPSEKRVVVEARPASIMYVGACPRGDLNPHSRHRPLAPQASASAYSATRTGCADHLGWLRLANLPRLGEPSTVLWPRGSQGLHPPSDVRLGEEPPSAT